MFYPIFRTFSRRSGQIPRLDHITAGMRPRRIICCKTIIPMNNTITDRSRATAPRRTGGMSLRSALTGGSVIVNRISKITAITPEGRQSLEKDWIISTMIRASNRNQKIWSAHHNSQSRVTTVP